MQRIAGERIRVGIPVGVAQDFKCFRIDPSVCQERIMQRIIWDVGKTDTNIIALSFVFFKRDKEYYGILKRNS